MVRKCHQQVKDVGLLLVFKMKHDREPQIETETKLKLTTKHTSTFTGVTDKLGPLSSPRLTRFGGLNRIPKKRFLTVFHFCLDAAGGVKEGWDITTVSFQLDTNRTCVPK